MRHRFTAVFLHFSLAAALSGALQAATYRSATGQDLQSKVIADAPPRWPRCSSMRRGVTIIWQTAARRSDAGEPRPDLRFDLERSQRPQGLGWDAGAFEGTGVLFVDGVDAGSAVRWTVPLP
jgi:hypothetical protein